ncbi:hypothetical protein [Ciceribacter sp. RN22]|uniref:hypothetical protein n=1 Tax=Ciceribacter sp. RN22 TaxID=2954932 RepID=UPI002093C252|nr:hypothetical protein [Ciceribacter sp. RN22]MCO6180786.1 hypothetical protein [Ciceribacter sp. RN22]
MSDDNDDDRFEFDAEERGPGWAYAPVNFLILIAPLAGVVLFIIFSFGKQAGPIGSLPLSDNLVTSSIPRQPVPMHSK